MLNSTLLQAALTSWLISNKPWPEFQHNQRNISSSSLSSLPVVPEIPRLLPSDCFSKEERGEGRTVFKFYLSFTCFQPPRDRKVWCKFLSLFPWLLNHRDTLGENYSKKCRFTILHFASRNYFKWKLAPVCLTWLLMTMTHIDKVGFNRFLNDKTIWIYCNCWYEFMFQTKIYHIFNI